MVDHNLAAGRFYVAGVINFRLLTSKQKNKKEGAEKKIAEGSGTIKKIGLGEED